MLRTLYIENIVLIKSLLIDFKPGLSVFTGETGAGKSILLDALSLVLGSRADTKLIKKDSSQGTVVATFEIDGNNAALDFLQEVGIRREKSEPLLLKRIVTSEGSSRAFINDQPVSVSSLKSLSHYLIEIHGQFDLLLDANNHRKFLDQYASLTEKTAKIQQLYSDWQDLQKEYQELMQSVSQERKILLEHYLKEFEEISPKANEEKSLQADRTRFLNADRVKNAIKDIIFHLNESSHCVEHNLAKAIQACETASTYDTRFSSYLETLSTALIQSQEVSRDIHMLLDADSCDTNDLESVENRLSSLKDLSRKHNCTIIELPQIYESLIKEFSALEKSKDYQKELEEKSASAKEVYKKEALSLSELRGKASKHLQENVMLELPSLKMDRALFQVCQKKVSEDEWGPFGIDSISFEVSPNGTTFGSLKHIASGGERSRLMLALKVILTSRNNKTSIIFDEIDSGVGGAVSTSIGERLYKLSSSLQVFSITHAPQIAAWSDHHYKVEKTLDEGGTVHTTVQQLNKQQSEEEIARMLSGQSITNQAREAAKSLKERCGK